MTFIIIIKTKQMQNFNFVVPENRFHLIHRIKQLNVLTLPKQPPVLILLLNLYNRTSLISFYCNRRKIFTDFNPNTEILKIKLTNLKLCGTFMQSLKNEAYLLILTPFSLILYSIFLQKKIKELSLDQNLISHKNSFDDFLIIPLDLETTFCECSFNNGKKAPRFLIVTSSNDCTIKLWNLMSGLLLKTFNSMNMNKHFLFIPLTETSPSMLLSIFNGKIFDQTKLEVNIWDWKRGELKKIIKNIVNFRSVLQMECRTYGDSGRNLILIGGVENIPNYKIYFLDWKKEVIVKKIENLCCFSFFVIRKPEEDKEENVLIFNKQNVSLWGSNGENKEVLINCQDDFFNFTTGIEMEETGRQKSRIVIGKGLNVYGF